MLDYAVFIGRFQPFHKGHLETAKKALKKANHLIILLGSSDSSRNLRNPFTATERRNMISEVFKDEGLDGRVTCLNLRDFYYSDNLWTSEVQRLVTSVAGTDSSICLAGIDKDESSYYLKLFPQWKTISDDISFFVNATDIRDAFFNQSINSSLMPMTTYRFLCKFLREPAFAQLRQEYDHIKEYRDSWSKTPYPVIFVTTDAVVTCGGHLLLVVRKDLPGQGLWALPGGFLGANERIEDGCIRELKEETGIKVPVPVLKGSIKSKQVFDFPGRSARGRVITHAFYIDLQDKGLPKITASSDAAKVMWVPISEALANPHRFYEDHGQIIEMLLSNNN
ncbi:MAG: bifunctional nicotinamide-nucleotide adenylyltransferase/Nudix hydroxylase [Candidatus Doudnabacteria bacterium]|nr:bifunctional nicotinamide-nucleotide adenylyltransferase/Nudix hydroxylase [Candidatus Doudnabacteria bacterium]